jgi:hypothetical protein
MLALALIFVFILSTKGAARLAEARAAQMAEQRAKMEALREESIRNAYKKVTQRLFDLQTREGELERNFSTNNPLVQGNLKALEAAQAEKKRMEEANPGLADTAQDRGASDETWSPALAPGAKPDLQGIMSEATDLMNRGRFDEALGRQIWFFNHAVQLDPSYSAVRLSFTLSAWRELARRYPKALQALTEVRDRDVAQFAAGRGYAELFQEVESINRELGDPEATCKLCKTIADKDPNLACQCYYYAQQALLEQGQYELCSRFMGDPQARFNAARSQIKTPGVDYFVGQVCALVEILVGTGHKSEAENISAQAIAVLDDPRLHFAVTDAEARIAKRGK